MPVQAPSRVRKKESLLKTMGSRHGPASLLDTRRASSSFLISLRARARRVACDRTVDRKPVADNVGAFLLASGLRRGPHRPVTPEASVWRSS